MWVIARYRRATQAAPSIRQQPQWLSMHNILVSVLTEPNLIAALVKPVNSTLALDRTNQRPLWHLGNSHPIVTILDLLALKQVYMSVRV